MSGSFATAWTVAHQAPLSMDFSGKNTEVIPFPGDLLNPGTKPKFPRMADRFFITESPGSPLQNIIQSLKKLVKFCHLQKLEWILFLTFFSHLTFFSYELKMDLRKGKVGSLEIDYVINLFIM